MTDFITIRDKNTFLLSTDLLGLNEAQLWIGPNPDGPLDNDDARVIHERAQAERDKQLPGQRISGIEAVDLAVSSETPGYFVVDTTSWQPGIYRFNIHSKANVQAPHGTPLRPIRDGQYSWPDFSDDYLLNLSNEQKSFLYLERNNAGFCIRIEKLPDGTLRAAGNGTTWIPNWPELKKQTEKHYEEKMQQA